ncbi:MAG: hypothetical protein ABII64_05470 [Elusimicrobiota bacterium]
MLTKRPAKQILKNRYLTAGAALLLVFLLVCGARCWARGVYPVYSDAGMPGDNLYTWGDWSKGALLEESTECPGGNAEGFLCMKTSCPAGASYCGYGIFFNSPGIDLSAYLNGSLRFWVYSTTGDAKIEIEDWDGDNSVVWLRSCGWNEISSKNVWTLVSIPISSFTAVNPNLSLSKIKYPFKFTLDHQGNYAYTDLVRWVENLATNTVYASLQKTGSTSNVSVSSITWNPVYPSTWNVADTYIKVEYDPGTINWGIRIYTDNKDAGANPRYTGPLDDASGLVCSTGAFSADTPLKMSWAVEDSTHSEAELGFGTPDDWVAGGFAYKWLIDKSLGNLDGDNLGYASLWTNEGLLYGTWDSGTPSTRAWKNSPNYIYFGANFETVRPGRRYGTNRLIVELYYE